jgi:hypothetical protein
MITPELLSAVKERIDLGYSKADITNELAAAGYEPATIDEVYAQAVGGPAPIAPPLPTASNASGVTPPTPPTPQRPQDSGEFIDFGALIVSAWAVFVSRIRVFAQTFLVNAVAVVLAAIAIGSMNQSGFSLLYGFERAEQLSDTSFLTENFASVSVLEWVLALFLLTVSAFMLSSTLRNLLAPERESLLTSCKWILQENRFFGFVTVSVFLYLAVQTGILLLIVPGVMLLVYLIFSTYTFIDSGVRGLDAMLRSVEIVYQRWWGVVARLILMLVLVFVGAFIAGLLFGAVIAAIQMASPVFAALLEVVMILLIAITVMGFALSYLATMYRSLDETAKSFSVEAMRKLKFWLRIAVILGPFAMIIFQLIPDAPEEGQFVPPEIQAEIQALAEQQMGGVITVAEQYYEQGGFSYFGVCPDLESLVAQASDVQCNDAIESWALTATFGTDTWCADSTGFNKRIQNPLGERTQCLDLPSPGTSRAVSP